MGKVAAWVVMALGFWVQAGQPVEQPDDPITQFEKRVIELVNVERTAKGLQPLKPEAKLARAARWMAEDMAANDYLGHVDSLGRDLPRNFEAFEYVRWRKIGQNVAKGALDPESVMKLWMNSDKHRTNILSPDFTEIGVGYCPTGEGTHRHYWVQNFGKS